MAQQRIGVGQGNQVPETEIKRFLANGAIAKGDVLSFYGTTGYEVDQASATLPPMGVAAEGAADNAWFNVIVSGFCSNVTCTATDVADGDMLYAVASGDCDGIAYGTDVGVQGGGIFGIALQAQTGTTITAAYILKRV